MILLFIVFGVIIPTYLGVSAAILKWAVTITNAVLGGRKPTDLDYEFRGDSNIPVLKNKDGILIPELSSGYALAVVMIMNLLNLLVQVAFGMLAFGITISSLGTGAGLSKAGAKMADTLALFIGVPLALAVQLGILSGCLQTTVAKTIVVIIFETILWVLLALVVLLGLFLFGMSVQGLLPK
jgi:hypothetical protein